MKKRTPTARQISIWQEEIERNGTKRLSVRQLLKTFGLSRRGTAATERVMTWLHSQEPPIHTTPLNLLKSLDETVSLTRTHLKQIGHIAELEKHLMDRFEAEIMPALKLRRPVRDYRPCGSRDALDFLCEDEQGRAVVVELKKKDGEKKVVEQVLRYIRHIRLESQFLDPRGVIVTGVEDPHTRKALEELAPGYIIEWYIYGLTSEGGIIVERIDVV